MISLFTATRHSGTFRLRWRGYDREQVDEFLRQTAADRERLEENLAQLEAFMSAQGEARRREFERLATLRVEIASCLETSIGALRTATQLLSKEQSTGTVTTLHAEGAEAAEMYPLRALREASLVRFQWRRPAWMSHRRAQALAASVFLSAVVPASFYYRSSAREITADVPISVAAASSPVDQASGTARGRGAPLVERAGAGRGAPATDQDGLVLTLTARRPCWIRTRIDGGQTLERLLKVDETIMLRANEEVFLRVGDASALSMLINNRLAKPLGTSGEVVAARITRANYQGLLIDD